jgi:hypothetical protein
MRKTVLYISALASAVGIAPAALGQSGTYYYCYAYESGGDRVWISNSLKFVSDWEQKDATHRNWVRTVRAQTGESYFSATGCRPPWDSADSGAVEDDRLSMVDNERGYGKSVIFLSW